MKKLISTVLLFCFMSNVSFADCDFSKGITPGPNDTFIYSGECHRKVGSLLQDNAAKDKTIGELNQVITLKDLAIQKADQRTQLWMDTSFKMEDRLNEVDSIYKKNEWLYFALGIVVTGAAVYGAGQLVRH